MNAPVQFVMVLPASITAHQAAAIIGRLGGKARAEKARAPIRAKCRELRDQMGLPPHPGLRT